MTRASGEAGSTFGFGAHEDGTPSSRTSTLSLEDTTCRFEGRYEPEQVVYEPAAAHGVLHATVRCARGEETRSEEAANGVRIAFLFGEELAIRFGCHDTTLIRPD